MDVKPRSKDDTLGNAFVRMVDGLSNLVRNVRDAASQVASASSQVAGRLRRVGQNQPANLLRHR